jgi:hypothetical protein
VSDEVMVRVMLRVYTPGLNPCGLIVAVMAVDELAAMAPLAKGTVSQQGTLTGSLQIGVTV